MSDKKNKCPEILKCTYPHCSCMPMKYGKSSSRIVVVIGGRSVGKNALIQAIKDHASKPVSVVPDESKLISIVKK